MSVQDGSQQAAQLCKRSYFEALSLTFAHSLQFGPAGKKPATAPPLKEHAPMDLQTMIVQTEDLPEEGEDLCLPHVYRCSFSVSPK
jgi:hypothetical protein